MADTAEKQPILGLPRPEGSIRRSAVGEGSCAGNESVGYGGNFVQRTIAWLGLLLGMEPQKLPEPARARGAAAIPEKVLYAGELAAQVSDVVADAVMSKLAAIGLTAENIKKLESLGEAAPLDAAGRGLQAASLIDVVSSKQAAIDPPGKNVEKLLTIGEGTPSLTASKCSQVVRTPLHSDDDLDNLDPPSPSFTEDPFDSSTWAAESSQRNSFSNLQMSGDQPKQLPEGGQLLVKMQQSAMPSRPPKDLHPFETLPQLYYSPMQFSGKRKRAIPGEEAIPQPKKMARHNEVDCEKNEFLMVNDKVVRVRGGLGKEWSECLRSGGEIQVDIPLR